MKRKERTLLIVSGIVSLASQLPSCKSTNSKPASNVLSENSDDPKCDVNTKGGRASDSVKEACAAVLKWVRDTDRFSAVSVNINANGMIQITFASQKDKSDADDEMARNLHFVKDNSGWWNYHVNPISEGSGKGGSKGGSDKGGLTDGSEANRIVMFVQDNDKGGSSGKGGKGGN